MKKILLLFMVLLSLSVNAQVETEGIVECENMTKEQIWDNVKRWQMIDGISFDSSIDSEDKEIGIIILRIGKRNEFINSVSNVNLYSKIRIEIKEGEYKYSFFDGKFDFKIKDIDGVEYMSTKLLLYYKNQLSAIENIVRGRSTIPEGLNTTISIYSDFLKNQPKYRKPKDEKKGKVNPRWEELNETVSAADLINSKYQLMILSTINSLRSRVKE